MIISYPSAIENHSVYASSSTATLTLTLQAASLVYPSLPRCLFSTSNLILYDK